MRILVDTTQECYLVLGLIHAKYRPMPRRFKDYIAMPKPNMYQSLHTTVFGIDGYLFEIQIRTPEMDAIAENGVASHWSYKEHKDGAASLQTATEQKLQFFKSIIDLSNDKLSSEDFVNSVRDEVLNNNIYCFTPKGDVIELPLGATPIDFAYKIHTQVGETMVGALVNNSVAPLDYELKDNDIVKILTNKSSTPSKEWVNIVKSTAVKNKIRSFFAKSERELYIERGKDALERALRKRKLPIHNFFNSENLKKICEKLKLESLDEIYLEIGNGKNAPNSVINIIEKEEEEPVMKKVLPPKESDADIIVSGLDMVKVNIANCCNPVYGDDIIGYITKGNGISIHRCTCHNLDMLDNRMVEVSWNSNSNNTKYLSNFLIHSITMDNYIADIVQKACIVGVSIDGIKNMYQTDGTCYDVSCYVTSKKQLEKFFAELIKEPYIKEIERLMR